MRNQLALLSLFLFSLVSSAAPTGAADTVMRMPASGSGKVPRFGSIDLSKSAAVGSSILPEANGGSNRSAPYDSAATLENVSFSASVGSNALTIAVKTKAGTDASSTDKIRVGTRSSTVTSGAYNLRTVTGALSLVISSGSTLGHINATDAYVYLYFIDNAGTLEFAASSTLFDDGSVVSTTAEGGAGAADSFNVMYSTTARSNVPCRLIGRMKSNQTTAGTWAAVPTEVTVGSFLPYLKTPTVQKFTSGSGTYTTPPGTRWIRVRMVGGGGGGGGSGTSNGTSGTNGGNTTFGSSLLVANGGSGATRGAGTAGGTASLGSGPVGLAITGAQGSGGGANSSSAAQLGGSTGGASVFGGAGAGGAFGGVGGDAATNSGSGGGGAGQASGVTSQQSGGGGGAGGYVDAIITSPLTSYAYAVGAASTAGVAGTSGFAGGAGAAGQIEVEEF